MRYPTPKPIVDSLPPILRGRRREISLSTGTKDGTESGQMFRVLRGRCTLFQEPFEVVTHTRGRADRLDPSPVLFQARDPFGPTIERDPGEDESLEDRGMRQGNYCPPPPAIDQ
jgi:hypothetical protein